MKKITAIILIMGLFSIFGCGNKTNKEESKSSDKEIVFSLPYLGDLNLNATKDLETEIKIDNNEVSVDLNFDEDEVAIKQIENVKIILDKIDKYVEIAKQKIKSDFDDNGVVRDYFEHHNEVVPEIKEIYKDDNEFLVKLNLIRIGFYPENESHYAVFAFSIGRNITDYIIVVRFDRKLNINSIDFVS
jgi:hypothetical protein